MVLLSVAILVVVNENDTVVGIVDVNSNIDDEEKEAIEQWGICIGTGGGKGGRWGICVGVASLYLLFLLWCCFASALASEEEDEASEAFALSTTTKEEEVTHLSPLLTQECLI